LIISGSAVDCYMAQGAGRTVLRLCNETALQILHNIVIPVSFLFRQADGPHNPATCRSVPVQHVRQPLAGRPSAVQAGPLRHSLNKPSFLNAIPTLQCHWHDTVSGSVLPPVPFIVTPSTLALPHTRPASAGTSSESSGTNTLHTYT
jgi:hypothetical protein